MTFRPDDSTTKVSDLAIRRPYLSPVRSTVARGMARFQQFKTLPILVFLASSVIPAETLSHSFYDPWCCNTSDCQPINADEVSEREDGYHYRQWVIPYKDARVSLDSGFHACEYPKGTMRCFYAPGRAF